MHVAGGAGRELARPGSPRRGMAGKGWHSTARHDRAWPGVARQSIFRMKDSITGSPSGAGKQGGSTWLPKIKQ